MLISSKEVLSRKSNVYPSYYRLLRGLIPAASVPIVSAGRTCMEAPSIATLKGGRENMGLELFLVGFTASISLAYCYYYFPQLSKLWKAGTAQSPHEADAVQELQEGSERELELEEPSVSGSKQQMPPEGAFWIASVVWPKLNPNWILCFLAVALKPQIPSWQLEAEALSIEDREELIKTPRPDYTDEYRYMVHLVATNLDTRHKKKLKQEAIKNGTDNQQLTQQMYEAQIQKNQADFEKLAILRIQVGFLGASGQEQQQALDALAGQVGFLGASGQEQQQALDALEESGQEQQQALDAIAGQVGFLRESSQGQQQALDALEESNQQQWQALNSLREQAASIRAVISEVVDREFERSMPASIARIMASLERHGVVPQREAPNWVQRTHPRNNRSRDNGRGRLPDQ